MEQDKNTSTRVDPAVLNGLHRQLDDHLSDGDAKLMINLGYAFEKGETVHEPVRQNYLAAAACYEAAARLGDAVAMNNLGWLYEHGNLGESDPKAAPRRCKTGTYKKDKYSI